MKILEINSFFSVGGPPRVVNGIYDFLKEQGHECKIAAARESLYAPNDSIMVGCKYSLYINALMVRLLDNDGFNGKRNTLRLIKQIQKYDPDIIHLHNLHGYYIDVTVLFSFLKQYGKPVVWTLHDCWPMTGHCTHFDSIGCSKWKTASCAKCPLKREYPTSFMADNSETNIKLKREAFLGVPNLTLVTVSNWLKDITKESIIGEYPIQVIPNGIDLTVFRPKKTSELIEKYNLSDKKIVLGVAQNWGSKKGLNDMVALSEKLNDEYKVVLVGVTEKQQNNLPDTVLALGRTNNSDELADWYSAAYVFINPSVEETMGLTTVEALACGTPAIVYNRTAVPEVIDSKCGWVVEAGKIEKVAEIIKNIPITSVHSANAILRAKEFERTVQYGKYLQLYSQIIEKGKIS